MQTSYVELVIKAPFLLVKGLLLGFMHGRGDSFEYFFDRKSSIRRETIGEMFRELLELDSHTYLCLPRQVVDNFTDVIEKVKDSIGIELESVKEIETAEFYFSFDIYNKEHAQICKEFIQKIPKSVELINFDPRESWDEEVSEMSGGYAPVHSYRYAGQGVARGGFGDLTKLYLAIKRSELSDSVLCSEMRLNFKSKEVESG